MSSVLDLCGTVMVGVKYNLCKSVLFYLSILVSKIYELYELEIGCGPYLANVIHAVSAHTTDYSFSSI